MPFSTRPFKNNQKFLQTGIKTPESVTQERMIFMKLFDAGKYFLKKCNAKSLSEKTIDGYAYRLKDFTIFLLSNHITEIEEVKEETIVDYLNHLKQRELSPATITGDFATLRVFFNTLTRDGILYHNPIRSLKKPKVPKIIVRAFNQEEVQELLDIFDKNTFLGYRNYTLFCVLFATGMRLSELLQLQYYDINMSEDYINVFGKGAKERMIPMVHSLKRVLSNYVKKRKAYILEKGLPSTPYLFISRNGQPLQKSGMNMIFSKIKKSKKMWSTRVSTHTWRHTFAKYFLLNGGDLFTLQKILGHEDITTTMIYLDMNIRELIMQNNKFNPLENKRWRYF